MAESSVVAPPQNPGDVNNPAPGADPTKVVLSKEEHADLERRASQSSQNYERLKDAEQKIEELKQDITTLQETQVPSGFQDERVGALANDVAEMKRRDAEREVKEKFPQLAEVWSDFETFRADPENKGMNLKTAAKAFLAEKGLTAPAQPRKGLENPTGGDRQPTSSGMTSEEIKRLRETDYKKYAEMLRKGQIKMS
jgi:hypothetical protein